MRPEICFFVFVEATTVRDGAPAADGHALNSRLEMRASSYPGTDVAASAPSAASAEQPLAVWLTDGSSGRVVSAEACAEVPCCSELPAAPPASSEVLARVHRLAG